MLLYRKLIIILIFLFFNPALLNTQDKKKEDTVKIKNRNLKNIEITLCDGRIVRGDIELQFPEKLIVKHELEGIEYSKDLQIDQIYEISIINWAPQFLEERKNGKLFKITASRFIIELKDSIILKVNSIQPPPDFLEQFNLINKFGKTTFYTYWIDLLKPDNTWFTGINGTETSERNVCFKDVVRKITFKEHSSK